VLFWALLILLINCFYHLLHWNVICFEQVNLIWFDLIIMSQCYLLKWIWLYMLPSVGWSVGQSVCLSLCLPACQCVCLSVCLSVTRSGQCVYCRCGVGDTPWPCWRVLQPNQLCASTAVDCSLAQASHTLPAQQRTGNHTLQTYTLFTWDSHTARPVVPITQTVALIQGVCNSWNSTGNPGNLQECEIAPGNTANLVEFGWCSWKIL